MDYMTPKLVLLRDVTQEECPWLHDGLRQGATVYQYGGYTYRCLSPEGIAVTALPDETPFFELPADALARFGETKALQPRRRLPQKPRHEDMRVLLIETDNSLVQQLEAALSTEHIAVFPTELAEEGVLWARLYDYDLVLIGRPLFSETAEEISAEFQRHSIGLPMLFLANIATSIVPAELAQHIRKLT